MAAQEQEKPRRVFISHAWESDKTIENQIKELAVWLNNKGHEVHLDYTSQREIDTEGGLQNWMEKQVEKADKVLVCVTKNYFEKESSEEPKVGQVSSPK